MNLPAGAFTSRGHRWEAIGEQGMVNAQRMATAQKTWLRLRGYKHVTDVITGVKLIDGIKQTGDQKQDAA